MKNKSIKTNSMKLKKVIAASLAISVLLAFTGCGSASSSTNNKKQESTSSVDAGSTDELNDLYQQENQLFADHKEDRKSTRLNSSHSRASRMPSSA